VTTFVAPSPAQTTQVQRDRWGRPLIIPPEGGKPVAYRRVTRFIEVLDDRWQLERWKQRQVAAGMGLRNDLVVKAASANGDRGILEEVVDAAMEAAGSSAAATTGTAVHRLAEHIDAGIDVPVPEPHRADIDAYRQATSGMSMVDIECFVVNDELQTGGTFDRLVEIGGHRFIADLKTGSTLEHNVGQIEMQLAIYARSLRYDPSNGARSALDVNTDWGLVIHLPAGQGRCEIWWANLADGWASVNIARQVWAWRSRRRRFARPYVPLADRVAQATSVDQLHQLWLQHADQWTDELTALAAARKQKLLTHSG